MFYSKKEIQKLIDNLDIVQVIGEYVNLKKAGSDYKGLSLKIFFTGLTVKEGVFSSLNGDNPL